MDSKICVVEHEYFMHRYFPRRSSGQEPEALPSLQWSGPVKVEWPEQAKETVSISVLAWCF